MSKVINRKRIETECPCCHQKRLIRVDQIERTKYCASCAGLHKWRNEYYRIHQIKVHTGKIKSKEAREKLSKALKGRKKSNEIMQNLWALHRKAEGKSNFNALYRTYKRSAQIRNINFALEKEYFRLFTKEKCYYCGNEPSSIHRHLKQNLNGNYIYNGIDRIDNTKGYEIGNIVTCCKTCNYAKRTMTLDEFKNWVVKIYNNFIQSHIKIA